MPWKATSALTDADLRAMLDHLMTQQAAPDRVPDPVMAAH